MFKLTSLIVPILLFPFTHVRALDSSDDLKNLTLPWGTYVAKQYGDEYSGMYVFKNVRFGAKPSRFGKPSFPNPIANNSEIQDNSFGPSCIQASMNAEAPSPPPRGPEDEDCLFLDIYLPVDALDAEEPDYKIPVVVSIFGGAYIFGGKDTVIKTNEQEWSLYDGQGILAAANNQIIWIVANYRLGAFGWLAGETMERHGAPNAALYDQRLVFEFVQKYIGQVKGDKNAVSAWGNSAGAGSIIHHLTAFNGTQAPLFSRAVLWSPAYQWAWDRKGTLEDTYQTFAAAAGCGKESQDLECLRKADNVTLKAANQEIVNKATSLGLFPFGPAVDGSWVKSLPAEQFKLNQTASLESLIVSHVWNEAGIFVQPWVNTTKAFTAFLNSAFPGPELTSLRASIETQYPAKGPPFLGDQQSRLRKVLQDSTFVCNSRQLYNAYKGKTYVLQYNMPPGFHGADLLASCWQGHVDVADLIKAFMTDIPLVIANLLGEIIVPFASYYQRYFASHALFGEPNQLKLRNAVQWDLSQDDGKMVDNALKAGLLSGGSNPFFNIGVDAESSSDNCDFWNGVADQIDTIFGKGEKSESTPSDVNNFLGLKSQGSRVDDRDVFEL